MTPKTIIDTGLISSFCKYTRTMHSEEEFEEIKCRNIEKFCWDPLDS